MSLRAEEILEHREWMRHVARNILGDVDAAEDVVQRAQEAALTAGGRRGPIGPWLRGVVRNLARTERLRARRRVEREEHYAAIGETVAAAPDCALERRQLEHRLLSALAQLPESLRAVVVLRYGAGMSSAEVAEQLGIPAGTVRTRLKRGLEQLRVALEEDCERRRGWILAWLTAPVEAVRRMAVGWKLGLVAVVALALASLSTARPPLVRISDPARGPLSPSMQPAKSAAAPRLEPLRSRRQLRLPKLAPARRAVGPPAPGGLPAPLAVAAHTGDTDDDASSSSSDAAVSAPVVAVHSEAPPPTMLSEFTRRAWCVELQGLAPNPYELLRSPEIMFTSPNRNSLLASALSALLLTSAGCAIEDDPAPRRDEISEADDGTGEDGTGDPGEGNGGEQCGLTEDDPCGTGEGEDGTGDPGEGNGGEQCGLTEDDPCGADDGNGEEGTGEPVEGNGGEQCGLTEDDPCGADEGEEGTGEPVEGNGGEQCGLTEDDPCGVGEGEDGSGDPVEGNGG